MTGSQNLALIRSISESLAGRVVVLDLGPMTLMERTGHGGRSEPVWLELLLDAAGEAPDLNGRKRIPREAAHKTVFDILWRGGYPRTLDHANDVLFDLFTSYVRTYVERDIRTLAEVQDQQQYDTAPA